MMEKAKGLLLSACVMLAFAAAAVTDAEKNHSTEMNAAPILADRRAEGGVKIAFLGNSITLHGKLAKIGWTNEWGMAASAAEKDYVHLVTRGIEQKIGRKADVRVRNLAEFERGFEHCDLEKTLADIVRFQPDYLIVAIGENVKSLEDEQARQAYAEAFEKLLRLFVDGGTRPKVSVVRGVFWPNAAKDGAMSGAAKKLGMRFIATDDLGNRPEMRATGLFWHAGVAGHPGDRGMAEIARRILAAIFPEDE